jgi:putative ubiquitin-RnfH superfamily antitoxin RatB of RatAB toxin-antitoxin module
MADGDKKRLRVEVAYALPNKQRLIALQVEGGTTVRQAIERSGIRAGFPDIRLIRGYIGIFGKPVELDALLRDGDRVEIYRSLMADPKETRRRRVKRRR